MVRDFSLKLPFTKNYSFCGLIKTDLFIEWLLRVRSAAPGHVDDFHADGWLGARWAAQVGKNSRKGLSIVNMTLLFLYRS